MFQALSRMRQDARTLSQLCTLAEQLAREQGRSQPGAEHFVLAALGLPDHTARCAFEQLGITAERFRQALQQQRTDALAAVGVDVAASAFESPAPPPARPRLYEADASGQALVQQMAAQRGQRTQRGLQSADVLLAAALQNHSATGRAFQQLGVGATDLQAAAARAMDSFQTHASPLA